MRNIWNFKAEIIWTLFVGVVFLISHFFLPEFNYFWEIVTLCTFLLGLYQKYSYLEKYDTFFSKNMKKINTMSGTGDQIFESCRQIDAATIDQSDSLINVSSSGEEIYAMIKKTGENMSDANNAVNLIHQTISDSNENAKNLGHNFKSIETENENIKILLTSVVNSLSELTNLFNNVAEKTLVINDIVFQTKLLSFNASVEAARAGEHGKGFSVVAEEIGNLASMSGESSNSIRKTLDETRQKVEVIIKDVNESSRRTIESFNSKIIEGQNVIEKFTRDFSDVTNNSNRIKSTFEEINIATAEQIKGISELKDAINIVNETVQRNNLVVGQTTDLANLLNNDLLELQNFYNVDTSYSQKISLDFLPWDQKYEIGIKMIDDEHIELLRRINLLIESMNENKDILESFDFMSQYAIDHFQDEEEYMESINYPSLSSHKKVHENLLNSVSNYRSEILNNDLNPAKLASFLKNWLFTHIVGVDIKYANHAKSSSQLKKIA